MWLVQTCWRLQYKQTSECAEYAIKQSGHWRLAREHQLNVDLARRVPKFRRMHKHVTSHGTSHLFRSPGLRGHLVISGTFVNEQCPIFGIRRRKINTLSGLLLWKAGSGTCEDGHEHMTKSRCGVQDINRIWTAFTFLPLSSSPSPDMKAVSNMSKMTRYYKPMLYSAVVIIYASLGFRIFRLSYISHQLGKRRDLQKA